MNWFYEHGYNVYHIRCILHPLVFESVVGLWVLVKYNVNVDNVVYNIYNLFNTNIYLQFRGFVFIPNTDDNFAPCLSAFQCLKTLNDSLKRIDIGIYNGLYCP